jgi:hypothetical protein
VTDDDPWDRPFGGWSMGRGPRWLRILWIVVAAGIILRLSVLSLQWLLS